MQLIVLNMWRLGAMDSLHVTSHHHNTQQPTGSNSKTSSRSASPCRPRDQHQQQPHHPHHVKTLSHGSMDSAKSQDGGIVLSTGGTQHRPSRHRSPTTNNNLSNNNNTNTTVANLTTTTTTIAGAVVAPGNISGTNTTTTTTTRSEMDQDVSLLSHHYTGSPFDDSGTTNTSAAGGGGGVGEGLIALDSSDLCFVNNSSFLSNGSGSATEKLVQLQQQQHEDETDSIDPKISATLEHLTNKIVRVRDLIRTEQKLRDDNVNEYLKLAANADKQQVQRIKAVFEKKNQKSAQVISQLQKKLDAYQKRVHELETHGLVQSHRPPREVLRDMGQGLKNVGGNIRDGITGFSGSVMSKPREFAHLIKNKFGSADNISQLSTWYIGPGGVAVPGTANTGSEGSGVGGGGPNNNGAGSDQGGGVEKARLHHGGSATLPATLHAATSQTSMGLQGQQGQQQHHHHHHHQAGGSSGHHNRPTNAANAAKFPSDEGSECSSVTSDSIGRFGRTQESGSQQEALKTVYKQLNAKQEEIEALREKLDSLKTLPQEIQYLNAALQEERFRTERLEEQINDLTELHQNEVENLKQAMADMEEKVQYQSEERLRDIHEILEHCQTKIQKMEHQALQQQQYVTLEGIDNSNARALVVKLINILLTVLQVVLLLVATGAGIIMPFLRTRVRILTTVFIVLATVFILRQWPEVQDIGSHVMKRLKDMLDPVK